MTGSDKDYSAYTNPDDYSDSGFWNKIKKYAKTAGRSLILQALELYYVAQDKNTPTWAKTAIYGALAYFILPADVIPDALAGLGFSDDLSVLVGVYKAVSDSLKPDHTVQAEQKIKEWFD